MTNKLKCAKTIFCVLFSFLCRVVPSTDSHSLPEIAGYQNLQVNECGLSDEVVEQIYKPSMSTWFVNDEIVQLLNNNLQLLINCTKPNDTVEFKTNNTIEITETVKILHELAFVASGKISPTSGELSESQMTTFACPASGPVLSINAPKFTATGLNIESCSNSSDLGIIVIFPRSTVIFNCLSIHDNQRRAIYTDRNTIVKIVDSRIERNQAPVNGTGMNVMGKAFVSIINSVIRGNSATEAFGGGIYFGHRSFVSMNNCTIADNSAREGGGLFFTRRNTISVVDSTFTNNSCRIAGGAISINTHNNATIVGTRILNNTAYDGGSGIFVLTYNNIKILGATISNNVARIGGGGIGVNSYNNVTIYKSTISHNAGYWGGGGLYFEDYNNVTLYEVTLSNNIAYYYGGSGLTSWTSNNITFCKCTVSNNTSLQSSGAVQVLFESTIISIHSLFSNNTGGIGGAIDIFEQNNATIYKSIISNNTADEGGAMNLGWENNLTIIDSLLLNNYGEYTGDYVGVYLDHEGNSVIVKNSTLSNPEERLYE